MLSRSAWTAIATCTALAGCAGAPPDLSGLLTQAEATGFEETTRYDDVFAFMDAAAGASDRIHATTFGESYEGRPLPLAVYGGVRGADPMSVRDAGGTRVLVLANIHAGEVAGKEAALILLRELAAGAHAHWADSLVVMVAPIYNADGNERIAYTNRPRQHGPVGGMGTRANAQGLDLNRDNMKLDSPEARSLARAFTEYDPHVFIDLHTTNGTRHAYHLTYSPPLHPATDTAIIALLREDWLPAVTDRIRERDDWEFYYYGNVGLRGPDRERVWATFDHRPRFTTNLAGVRNRFGILSEAYSYATFEDRVAASRRFVEELLDFAHANASGIRQATAAADARALAGRELAVRGVAERSGPVEILLGEVVEEPHPQTGEVMLRRTGARIPEMMYEYGSFAAAAVERVPAAYIVPPVLDTVIERLTLHGIRMEVLEQATTVDAERFRITAAEVADRPFQGRHERRLEGEWSAEPSPVSLAAGTVIVPTDQPLGRLAFLLLEPRSDDGLANWGLLDDALEDADAYPIRRTFANRF